MNDVAFTKSVLEVQAFFSAVSVSLFGMSDEDVDARVEKSLELAGACFYDDEPLTLSQSITVLRRACKTFLHETESYDLTSQD